MDAPTLRHQRAKVIAWTPLLGTASYVPKWKRYVRPLKPAGASTKNITTAGIDLAKNLLQVHGVDERGKAVLRKALKRTEVVSFFTRLQPCLIGMEACGSAHFWARKLTELGHTVRLMAPQFVKPYVKTNKNDARDAEGICEAVSRPTMRFVPIKTNAQQGVLGLHRARQGFVVARTAQSNQIRGLLAEFGFTIPKGTRYLERKLPEILEDAERGGPGFLDSFRGLDKCNSIGYAATARGLDSK